MDEYREQLISENVRKYQDVSLRLHNEEVSYRTLSKYQTLSLSPSLYVYLCSQSLIKMRPLNVVIDGFQICLVSKLLVA